MTLNQKSRLIEIAKNLIGKPYKYGARPEEAPEFFDCSSFIQYIFKNIGIDLPRSTIEQASKGEKIENLSDLKIGDLIFFHGTHGHYNPKFPEGIGHIALYIGEDKTIHAGSKRIEENPKIVEIGQVEERELDELIKKLKPVITIKRF